MSNANAATVERSQQPFWRTCDACMRVIVPLAPFVMAFCAYFQLIVGAVLFVLFIIVEALYVHFRMGVRRWPETRMMLIGLVIQLFVMFAGIAVTIIVMTTWSSQFAVFSAGAGVLGFLYAILVYDFGYWLQHFLAHKVRLLWCIHSPHHAPQQMNSLVGINLHAFTSPYEHFMLGLVAGVLGADPLTFGAAMLFAGAWGNLLHVNDQVFDGKYPIIGRVLMCPIDHRVHHGSNDRYMDTNYAIVTRLWDTLFRCYQHHEDRDPVHYGITREVDTGSYLDTHWGEFRLLWLDIRNAPDWRAVLGYLLRPPGWRPGIADLDQDTATNRRNRLLTRESETMSPANP